MNSYMSEKSDKSSEKDSAHLARIKKQVQSAQSFFKDNADRFGKFKKFFLKTSLDANATANLNAVGKPIIEFNVGEAFLSKQRGEFFTHLPEVTVTTEDGYETVPGLNEVVEGYFRGMFVDANNNGFEYDTYTDTTSGGYSAIKVWTEYNNQKSFEQIIRFSKVYNATLSYFDPNATEPHKGDGNICGELFPRTLDDIISEYPHLSKDDFSFKNDSNSGFHWSYRNASENIVLVCQHYEKKKSSKEIVLLANGNVMTRSEYNKFIKEWDDSGEISVAPSIVKKRITKFTKIWRTTFVENHILEHVETDFDELPIIFVDGNSTVITDSSGSVEQFTKPYLYHAEGVQKLKNFAGQTLANELENMRATTMAISKQALPSEQSFLNAYTQSQVPSVYIFNEFLEDNPDVRLSPPMPIARANIPPEVINTFMACDKMMQSILGSYDAALGVNDNEVSGIAIMEGAAQSNTAAMPYRIGMLQGINQLAQVVLGILPKYYTTPRSIPVVDKQGNHSYVKINQEGGIDFKFDPDSLKIKVQSSVSFSLQKSLALKQISQIMAASPLFAKFMNEEGLTFILDNIEMRGGDLLKEKATEWMKKQQMIQQQMIQAQQQAQQQQANQPNPLQQKNQIEMLKIQQKNQMMEIENQRKLLELEQEQRKTDIELIKIEAEMGMESAKNDVQREKIRAENLHSATELAINEHDMNHRHAMETNTE